jgi:predicted RNase H-like HicB family nuclease
MSDVKRYAEERTRRDPAFAEGLDSGYETFRTEVLLRQKGEKAGRDRENESGRAAHQATRRLEVRIERDEGGCYVASVPALHGCHTQADSLDVLAERLQEVIELCLEGEGEAPEDFEVVVDTMQAPDARDRT